MRIHDTHLARIRPAVPRRGLKSGDFSYDHLAAINGVEALALAE